MSVPVYYNEIEPYAVAWLGNLMAEGLIPAGDIDTRSIEDVRPIDLAGYVQCHFFAGIGGWPLALALAGWPADRPVWTGSCPCQPFSVAGKGDGAADKRHLWPAWFHLISQQRPAVVFGEQVAAAVGHQWLDGVCADMEGQGYAIGASVLPACAVGAPHRRPVDQMRGRVAREYAVLSGSKATGGFGTGRENVDVAMAYASGAGLAQRERERGILREVGGESQGQDVANDGRSVAHAERPRRGCEIVGGEIGRAKADRSSGWPRGSGCGSDFIIGHDGKARRVEPSIRLLAHGLPARVGRLRAYGNAIVPQVAAEFIAAYAEARGLIDMEEVA